MKIIIRNISCIFLLSILLLGCTKTYEFKAAYETALSGNTNIKVFNSTLNATRNYIYNGTTPLNGAAFIYGGNFPSGTSYSNLTPGNLSFNIKDTAAVNTQLPVTVTGNFDAGKYYSIFTYDTITTAKAKVVQDEIVIPTDTAFRLRFANFMFTRTPVPNVDIFSFRANANIATNVAITDVTNFVNHVHRADTLYVRSTGTTTPDLIKTAYTFVSKRSYTLILRGRYQNTGTMAVPRTMGSFNTY